MSKPMDDDEDDLGGESPEAPQLATAILGSVAFKEDIDLNEQTSDTMTRRAIEQLTKIRTEKSEIVEMQFMDDLEDLRLLIAKEYSNLIKEFEVHRIFKSNLYNSAEHRLTSDNKRPEMTPNERQVLLGHCLHVKHKVDTLSPLMNEVHCSKRNIDYRMYGLGIVKYPRSTSRSTKSATSRKKSTQEQLPIYNNIVLPLRGSDEHQWHTVKKTIVRKPLLNSNNNFEIANTL
ncbi:unnamed protein product [Spodoptera exigua]|nr:unnamed protein product [Spodoptera exigua]